MGCKFCASTMSGFVRNLTAAEMLSQLDEIERDCENIEIQTVVIMGIGEPLDNYDNIIDFLKLLSDPQGRNKSLRNVCLSTCGLVPQIKSLAEQKFGLTLCISLHATTNQKRNELMPINKKWNLEQLVAACNEYTLKTKRRISLEYALISGENDGSEDAKQLVEICKQIPLCHVNLIPINQTESKQYHKPNPANIKRFCEILQKNNVTATIRRKTGSDINASCGQLRRQILKNK